MFPKETFQHCQNPVSQHHAEARDKDVRRRKAFQSLPVSLNKYQYPNANQKHNNLISIYLIYHFDISFALIDHLLQNAMNRPLNLQFVSLRRFFLSVTPRLFPIIALPLFSLVKTSTPDSAAA
jgi:hypothetical protein